MHGEICCFEYIELTGNVGVSVQQALSLKEMRLGERRRCDHESCQRCRQDQICEDFSAREIHFK